MSEPLAVEDLVERRAWDEVRRFDEAELRGFVVGVLEAYLAGSPIIHIDRLRSLGITLTDASPSVAQTVLGWLEPDPQPDRFVPAGTLLTGLWQFGDPTGPDAHELAKAARRLAICAPPGAGPAFVLSDALAAVCAHPEVAAAFGAEARRAVDLATENLPAAQATAIRARLRSRLS
jgi:hypothetical protein